MNSQHNAYRCIVVDDNEIDRLTTVSFIKKYTLLRVEAVFSNSVNAYEAISRLKPDVIFLDIDMDDLSGIELRRKLGNEETCIFITSYPDYALESFEVAAFDFLVKPVHPERFGIMMERLEQYLTYREKAAQLDASLGAEYVVVKEGHTKIKVPLHDILYLEALKDYTRIVTVQKKYCVLSTLGNLLTTEPFLKFVRIHRSFAVQPRHINSIRSGQMDVHGIELPIGRNYKEQVSDLLS